MNPNSPFSAALIALTEPSSTQLSISPNAGLDTVLLSRPMLALANAGDIKAKLTEVLTIIMLFGFLYGTVRIIGGAMQIRRGETEEGKQSIIAGALIAAAPLIMRILFGVFGSSEGSL
jgi:4-hydroxybenzoate polyprenyltransferase